MKKVILNQTAREKYANKELERLMVRKKIRADIGVGQVFSDDPFTTVVLVCKGNGRKSGVYPGHAKRTTHVRFGDVVNDKVGISIAISRALDSIKK